MFENKKSRELNLKLPDDASETLKLEDVIEELRKNHLKEKEELFIQAGTVRPGIIVLVNDTDWELLDNEKYEM